MNYRKQLALPAELFNGWVDNGPLTAARQKKLEAYVMRFVIRSEAIGATRQTSGFVEDLSLGTTEKVRDFVKALKERIPEYPQFPYESYLSSSELVKFLTDNKLESFSLCNAYPFVAFTYSESNESAKAINRLEIFNSSHTRETKRDFYKLNALFRHMRNALAHGHYKCIEYGGRNPFWAFQDVYQKRITARILLPEATLDAWVALIDSRDIRLKNVNITTGKAN